MFLCGLICLYRNKHPVLPVNKEIHCSLAQVFLCCVPFKMWRSSGLHFGIHSVLIVCVSIGVHLQTTEIFFFFADDLQIYLPIQTKSNTVSVELIDLY